MTSDFFYDLLPELIAKAPADPPDASRLMVLRAGGGIEHRHFSDLPDYLRRGDVLVVNETRVIRARLHGRRLPGGGKAELLLLRPLDVPHFDPNARRWEAMVRPGQRLGVGRRIQFGEAEFCQIVGRRPDGLREIEFEVTTPFGEFLERYGEMPLPPYVGPGDEARAARYQTIFARIPGGVAAPTASLHFTPRVLDRLRAAGVEIVPLVLDVGYATFKPITTERIADHVIHAERYEIPEASARTVNGARRAGRRIVAAGTTVVRALESAFDASASGERGLLAGESETRLFITPGFEFRVVDALLTNFHLPGSSLLVLVAAFAGYERTIGAYRLAIGERYRFYSFGDAMLIERKSGH